MLNEGIHVDGVNAVVLCRPTKVAKLDELGMDRNPSNARKLNRG